MPRSRTFSLSAYIAVPVQVLLIFLFPVDTVFSQGAGTALHFDGVDDFVTRSYDADFDFGTGSFTVSGWFKTSSVAAESGTLSVRVSQSSDDAEEAVPGGNMYLTSSDLELVDDIGEKGDQEVGMRFQNVALPQGANIINAHIQFTVNATDNGATNLVFYGEDADDASTFTNSSFDITGRIKTSASVNWNNVPGWSVEGEAGPDQRTPDLSSIIQEIIDRGGWSSGNSIAIIVDGTGERTVESYDGSSQDAPLLEVTYGYQYLVSRYDSDQGFKIWMEAGGKIAFGFDDDAEWGPDAVVKSSGSYKDTTWHHFTAVKDGTSAIYLYVDGLEDGSNTSLGGADSVSVRVTQDSDDAEEEVSNGNMDLYSTDLELVNDGGSEDQEVGMRFQDITVPGGAAITDAYIQFTVDETDNDTTNLVFYGEDADNASTFTGTDDDITDRTKTSASVNWDNVPAWNSVGEAGEDQKTPDLSSIIQEIIDRGGWSSGNSIVIIVDGAGERTAESHDGSEPEAPLLKVYYTTQYGTLTSDSAPFTIGSDEPANAHYFEGTIDEMRIWNSALAQPQIQDEMCRKLTGNESNLMGYWRFDDDTGTNASDLTSNTNDMTLTNFASGWITSDAPVGDSCNFGSGISNLTEGSGVPVDINWDGDNPGSGAVFNAIQVDENPDVSTGLLATHTPKYWELWITGDDGSFIADVNIHYDGFPGISNETYLALYARTGPGKTWSAVSGYTINAEGDINDGTGYITANDQTSFSQFILTSDEESLPVVLSYFGLNSVREGIEVIWQVESEISLLQYELYRDLIPDIDVDKQIRIEEGPDGGTSFVRTRYEYLDEDVKPGVTYYYLLVARSLDGSIQEYGPTECTYQLDESSGDVPSISDRHVEIAQNKPNPFNPSTTISFYLPDASPVKLDVYNLRGGLVVNLLDTVLQGGEHSVLWDGANSNGNQVASNVYICRLTTPEYVLRKRMLLLK